jgi:alkylation response protein AidB-like acyl-CoA dehydrogenase
MLDISQSCQSSSREGASGWSADGVLSICANLGKAVEDRSDRGNDQPQHEVPPENLIGEEGRGFRYVLDSMNAERILVAW